VRALETLGRHYVSDREVLVLLARLFSSTPSASVQAAIAGILLRADLRSISGSTFARHLLANRLPSAAGDSTIDALLRRLQAR
jgi:hypothetical protein